MGGPSRSQRPRVARHQVLERQDDFAPTGNRQFESGSLQRRIMCELNFRKPAGCRSRSARLPRLICPATRSPACKPQRPPDLPRNRGGNRLGSIPVGQILGGNSAERSRIAAVAQPLAEMLDAEPAVEIARWVPITLELPAAALK